MKSIKIAVPMMVMLALALFLTGCPKGDKMMSDDGMKKEGEMMDKQ